jgi:hypothetical protein
MMMKGRPLDRDHHHCQSPLHSPIIIIIFHHHQRPQKTKELQQTQRAKGKFFSVCFDF